MIKTLIFDNNGVLTDSDREVTVGRFADYFGVEKEEIEGFFEECAKPLDDGSITSHEFYELIAKKVNKTFKKEVMRKLHIESYQPKPGMKELVKKYKQDFEVVILTNFGDAFDEANEKVWKHHEVFDKDKIFVSCKMKMRKPNSDIYLKVLEELGRKPEETVFIDDRKGNVEAAEKLGINGIVFENAEQLDVDLEKLLEVEKVNA
jgi:epoxide hydrolase-like predicted phosphatase